MNACLPLVSILVAGALGGVGLDRPSTAKPEEILGRYGEARGGEDALLRVNTAALEGVLDLDGKSIPFELMLKRPKR